MNVADAAYATVHDYPGGSEALGARLGINAKVLRNKVAPNYPANQLGLLEADRIIGMTGDTRILQAMCAEHGGIFQRVDEVPPNESITNLVLDVNSAAGRVSQEIRMALSDGLISENEMRAIGAAGFEEQRVMLGLIAKLRKATGRHLRSVDDRQQG